MSDIFKPEIPDLKNKYLLMLKDSILKNNNLEIGDKILWEFSYQSIKSGYKRGEINRYDYKKLCKGVLKEDENGLLFAESIDDLEFYVSEYRNKISQKGHYYRKIMKKSIHYFGEGYIHIYNKNK